MDLIASFSSQRVRTFQFFKLRGILDDDTLTFLFDTGAAYSAIGINNLIPSKSNHESDEQLLALEKIIRDEIKKQGVSERAQRLKSANNIDIITYPCVSRGVSIEGSKQTDFYFDLALSDYINLPLLGSNFTDDCNYTHKINGQIIVSGMKDSPGAESYYGIKTLDFSGIKKGYIGRA